MEYIKAFMYGEGREFFNFCRMTHVRYPKLCTVTSLEIMHVEKFRSLEPVLL